MAILYKTIFLLLFLTGIIRSQYENIEFEHLTMDDGLSGGFVTDIDQDSKGFMWFCTRNGLNKYDGYKFTVYKHDAKDPHSISINWTRFMYEDSRGNLWIGTNGGGLDRFDRRSEKFIHFKHDSNNSNSICSNIILTMREHSNGELWIGTLNGLSQLIRTQISPDSEQVTFINYKHDAKNPNSISHNVVYSIYEDKNKNLWFGMQQGCVDKFERALKQFSKIINGEDLDRFWSSINYSFQPGIISLIQHIQPDRPDLLTIGTKKYIVKYDVKNNIFINHYKKLNDFLNKKIQSYINAYVLIREGSVWLGCPGKGLYLLDIEKEQIINYKSDPENPESLSSNYIYELYEDRQGSIWIGTMGSGINKYDKKKHKFDYYEIETGGTYSSVAVITEDHSEDGNILWLATSGIRGYGLFKFDRETKKIKNYLGHINSPIWSICQDSSNLNFMWVGSMGSGLYKFAKKQEKTEHISYRNNIIGAGDSFDYSNAIKYITSIIVAEKGYLWLGTLGGLFKFNTRTNQFQPYLHESENSVSLSENNISVICKSSFKNENELWIGTRYGGLYRFNPDKMTLVNFRSNESDSRSLNDNYVSSIYEDKSGTLWIGTPKGLNKFNREKMTFTHVMDKDKHLAVEITGILEDKKGNLWLKSSSGLYQFNPGTEKLKTYDKNDGLKISAFGRIAHFKNKSGEMFFGGKKGFINFHPDSIKENNHIPPIVLTDFQIFNKPVKAGIKNSPLSQTISETKEIKLTHDQSVFSFEFAALDFRVPQKNKYAYKMEGVDPDWVYTDASRRFVTYTQLDPGEYIFRAKGSNNDGIWNEAGTSLKIIILPPWWKTIWAYLIYVIAIGILLYAVRQYDLKRQKLKHQLELEHVHSEKLEEVDRIKSRFFANISHEFRTPLTLILGPAEQMLLGKFKGNLKEQYKIIIRNAKRLLQLINQLLDLSRLEAGKLKLQA
jgi:ligand-binding sensor domain-containing protein